MPTLFLSAPKSETQPGTHRRDFYTILANGIGPDYGLYAALISRICTGMKVVVFDGDRRLQAESVVVNYTPIHNTTASRSNGSGIRNRSGTALLVHCGAKFLWQNPLPIVRIYPRVRLSWPVENLRNSFFLALSPTL